MLLDGRRELPLVQLLSMFDPALAWERNSLDVNGRIKVRELEGVRADFQVQAGRSTSCYYSDFLRANVANVYQINLTTGLYLGLQRGLLAEIPRSRAIDRSATYIYM